MSAVPRRIPAAAIARIEIDAVGIPRLVRRPQSKDCIEFEVVATIREGTNSRRLSTWFKLDGERAAEFSTLLAAAAAELGVKIEPVRPTEEYLAELDDIETLLTES